MAASNLTAPAPIDLLPGMVDAVGDQAEIIVDSGIRRGVDVLKAIVLGNGLHDWSVLSLWSGTGGQLGGTGAADSKDG